MIHVWVLPEVSGKGLTPALGDLMPFPCLCNHLLSLKALVNCLLWAQGTKLNVFRRAECTPSS